VDDASDDGTSAMIQSYAPRGVKTLRHLVRSGVGSAIRTAIEYACGEKYDVLVIMAGNDKDNPNEIPVLLSSIEKDGFDFVQGSRYINKNGTGGDMPLYRKFATRLHPFLMSLVTFRRLTDTTNGFRAFRLSIFDNKNININQAWLNQYELEPYLLFKAIMLKFRFTEAPVTKIYPPKQLGYTKMKPFSGWWSILKPIFYLGLRIRR
jgi:dolichol-phosphate mannosyltransferase